MNHEVIGLCAGLFWNTSPRTQASPTAQRDSVQRIHGDLFFLSGNCMSIGMDCGWFASLEDAMRESMAWDGPNPEGYEVA